MIGMVVFLPLGAIASVVGLIVGVLTGTWTILWGGIGFIALGVLLPMGVMWVISARVNYAAQRFMAERMAEKTAQDAATRDQQR